MSRISELLAAGRTLSFEFFPPKTDEGRANLNRAIDALAELDPSFVSVTYGAGGSTRTVTRDVVVDFTDRLPFPTMPHLTCVGHGRAELAAMLDDYVASGVENILALAGDPPADGTPAGGDFEHATQLVELIREQSDLSIGVAAFPEGHPRSPSRAADRSFLAAKLNQADFAMSQFFYDPAMYSQLVADLAELGCDRPVVPGIMPMLNPVSIRRIAAMNGTTFPEQLAARVESAGTDREREHIAVEAAAELSHALLEAGAPGLHFYCLNRAEPTIAIIEALGLR